MSRNLVTSDNRQNYGAMAVPPDVTFSNFSPTEFYNLCEDITTNIYTVSSSWKNLEKALKTIGTPKDNVEFRENIHVSQMNSNQVVTVTTNDITRLNMVVRKGDKHQKLQVDKLTSDFKEAVEKYSAAQKQVADKMKANMLVAVNVQNEEQSDSEDNSELLKQQQVARELAFDQEMLIEQEARIKQIESSVLDVNEIMNKLSTIIHEQAVVVDSIENNIDATAVRVEEGTSNLQKASEYQNKARRKLIILVLLAVVIICILIGVLAFYLKR